VSCWDDKCGCSVTYKDFRGGWTYGDAYEMLAFDQSRPYGPSQGQVKRMLGKLKRAEWARHLEGCKAGAAALDDLEVDPLDFLDGLRGVGPSPGLTVWVVVAGVTAFALASRLAFVYLAYPQDRAPTA